MSDNSDSTQNLDLRSLIKHNGLVKLFANRTHARVIVLLMYAPEPLTVDDIADRARIKLQYAEETIATLRDLGLVDTIDDDPETYALDEEDELYQLVYRTAEEATKRVHPDPQ